MFYFFFQAEDGIRDWSVTGVQTCALTIYDADLIVRRHHRDEEGALAQRRGEPVRRYQPVRLDRQIGDRKALALRSEERRVGKEWRATGGGEAVRARGRVRERAKTVNGWYQ